MKSSVAAGKKVISRYYLNPSFLSILFSISSSPKTLNPSFLNPLNTAFRLHQLHTSPFLCSLSTGSDPNSSITVSIYRVTNCYMIPFLRAGLLRPHYFGRCLSVSPSSGFESNVDHKHVSQIIESIRSGGDSDLRSKLSLIMSMKDVSVRSVTEIFGVLNSQRIPALHFFRFIQLKDPKLCYSSGVCSLIIANCGWLEDYGVMTVLLKEFRLNHICLTEEAFEFLQGSTSNKDSIMEAIRKVIALLNEVGGSCRGSGICSLIQRLSSLESFEMAEFAIEITERNVSYYNIIIRERCRTGHIGEVHGLLEEMRKSGCDPNVKTYNYLLSNLCKKDKVSEACNLLQLMQESGTPPDALTFDILIHHLCRVGEMDLVREFIGQMASSDLNPRIQTHLAIVKSYFNSGNYKEALKYVRDMDNRYPESSNTIYSLLANLHRQKGNLIIAQSILVEMMEKDLKPNFLVYLRIMKQLGKTGKGSLSKDLRSRFAKFIVESRTATA